MRENEKERELAKRFRPNFINDPKSLPYNVFFGGFYSQTLTKYQKNQNNNYYRGTKQVENQKVTKKSQKVKNIKTSQQWQTFAGLQNFVTLAKLQRLLASSASLFFYLGYSAL